MRIHYILFTICPFLLSQDNTSVSIHVFDLINNPVEHVAVNISGAGGAVDQDTTDADGWVYLQIPVVGIKDETPIPQSISLAQNYPNPWNPTTSIQFSTTGQGRFSIYNILGQEIVSYSIKKSGQYSATWGGLNKYNNPVSAGVYIYSLVTEKVRFTRKMVLLDGGNTSSLHVKYAGQSLPQNMRQLLLYDITFSGSHIAEETMQMDITSDTLITNNVDIKPFFVAEIPTDSLYIQDTLTVDLQDFVYNDDTTGFAISGCPFAHVTGENEFQVYEANPGWFNISVDIGDEDGNWSDNTEFGLTVYFNPTQIDSIPDFVLPEDSSVVIDLTRYIDCEGIILAMFENLPNWAGVDLFATTLSINPPENYHGVTEGIFATIYADDGMFTTNDFSIIINPVNDAPTIVLNPNTTNVDEDANGGIVIANFDLNDVDGDTLSKVLYNSQPDSAFLRMVENQIILDSLANNFNGTVTYGVTVNDGQIEVSEQANLDVNAMPDVTFNIRTLNYAGTPIMDNIESTFQIGDSIYTAIGQITKQLVPGVSYEIWAENDSTGVFNDTLRVDPYIAIRELGENPLVTPALATRSLDDASSTLTIGTEDRILELYKISNLSLEDWTIMNYIIDTWHPPGIDKPNTATPLCYVDTSFAGYSEPSAQTLANAQYIAEVLMPTVSEGRYTPIWMGFGDAPDSDPEGETVLRFVFDNQYSPPGNSSNGINSDNILYYASVLSPPINSAAGLAGEAMQSFPAMQGDLPGGNELSYLLESNDEGQVVPTEFAKFIHRVRDYFNPGDNI